MSEMIDRVAARLIAVELFDYCLTKEEAEMLARAAIESMREPTNEMLMAFSMNPEEAAWYWGPMIDAALVGDRKPDAACSVSD